MKKKTLILISLLGLGIFFALYNFNRYPKKVVAEILYTVDDRIFEYLDKNIQDFGFADIFRKVKESGDYGIRMSLEDDKNDKLNIINYQSPNKKERYYHERREVDHEIKIYGEKIVNSDVYLYREDISDLPLYIDRNTMVNLSRDSKVMSDLGYDISNKKLFLPPVSLSEKNTELKKYVKKEWAETIRRTKVKKLSGSSYEVKVRSKDLKDLFAKIEDFYYEENYFPYSNLAGLLRREFEKISRDLDKRDQIVFYIYTDEDLNLLKLKSDDNQYALAIKDYMELKLPDTRIYMEPEENENLRTLKGKINDRSFRMSYYPDSKKLIYHDGKTLVNVRFYNFVRSKKFKLIADIDGAKIKKLNLNFYTIPEKIEREKNYIEILKLKEEDWQKLMWGGKDEK
ncbi:MAG: hypothetical protein E6Z55_07155 [Peptoniphilus harei]|nr:hypothetical protein [Peptoniphilus harei]